MGNELFFKSVCSYFKNKKIEPIIIGNTIRKRLYNEYFGKDLIDGAVSHLDFILKSNCSLKETQRIIEVFINDFKLRLHNNKISYKGKLNNQPIEFVGVIIKDLLYYTNFVLSKNRPDISIERIGVYSHNKKYDEYKRGFSDFKKKKIVINPSFKKKKIPLEKALKIVQIKFQTNFSFDKRTKELIINSLTNKGGNKVKFLIKLINERSKNKFNSVKEIKDLILQKKT